MPPPRDPGFQHAPNFEENGPYNILPPIRGSRPNSPAPRQEPAQSTSTGDRASDSAQDVEEVSDTDAHGSDVGK